MNYYALTSLFNGIVVLAISFYLFSRQHHNDLYQSCAVFSLCVGLWCVFYSFWQVQSSYKEAFMYMRLAMMPCYAIPFAFLWFVLRLIRLSVRPWQALTLLAIPLFFMMFSFSPLMIKNMKTISGFDFWPEPGVLTHFYVPMFFGVILFSYGLLWRGYLGAHGLPRRQIQWVMLALLPGWLGGATNWCLWYSMPVPPVAHIFVGVSFLLLFYAIIRGRLFDVSALADAIQTAKLTALGVIAASINHEIRNPLYVIKGLAETLAERAVDPLANKEQVLAKAKEIADKTIAQSDRVLGIIKSFSSYAKRETDKVYEKQRVRVKEVIEHILPFVESELNLKKITISQDIPEGLEVFADVQSLEEIFINLIVNACQAMSHSPSEDSKVNGTSPNTNQFSQRGNWGNPDCHKRKENKSQDSPGNLQLEENRCQGMPQGGEIVIKTEITTGTNRPRNDVVASSDEGRAKQSVVIAISDNGPGIPKEQLNRIFEPFYTTKAFGTGLGLYVVKQLVEKNGGKVGVDSKPGGGAIFKLLFPK